jgi:hypothetical protein
MAGLVIPKKRRKNPARVISAPRHERRYMRPGEFEVFKAGRGIHHDSAKQKLGTLLGRFPMRSLALEYAQAYATAHDSAVVVVGH